MTMNPYEVLGVGKNATNEQIREAYLALAKKHHPDTEGGDQAKFVEAKAAYDVLSDAHTRATYDEMGIIPGDRKSELRIAAMQNLCNMWSDIVDEIPIEVLAQTDLIKVMRDTTQKLKEENEKQIRAFRKRMAKTEKIRGMLEKQMRRKKQTGPNLFLMVIDKKIEAIKSQILPIEQKVECMTEGLEILGEYQFNIERMMRLSHFRADVGFTETFRNGF